MLAKRVLQSRAIHFLRQSRTAFSHAPTRTTTAVRTVVVSSVVGITVAAYAYSTRRIAWNDEGDTAKTRDELDDRRELEEQNSNYVVNKDGEIEWTSSSKRPRIVILGTGWGSVSFLKHLEAHNYEVIVISPRNYFLFTPLLPSATTGTLEMGSLIEPIRHILLTRHKTTHNQYVEAKAVGLDREKRKVQCVDSNGRSFQIAYDHLIVGVGANNATFGVQGVKEYAFFLKEAKHARVIRKNILEHFERASSPTTTREEKEKLLQFVVVGGGPTGVEFAGELVDFLDTDLAEQFPTLIPLVRVRLVQSQDHLLNTYDLAISKYAEEKFKELRIEVITGARVKSITEDSLTYEDKSRKSVTLPFGICLWSTGIEMNDFIRSVSSSIKGQDNDRALVTDNHLRILEEIPMLDRVPMKVVKKAVQLVVSETPGAVPPKVPTVTPTVAALEEDMAAGHDLIVDKRVYAIGDCATVYIPKLAKRMKTIFKAADTDGDGTLSYLELVSLTDTISKHFPIMSAQMTILRELARDNEALLCGDGLNLQQLRYMLEDADKNVRCYPATAQVASQQGKYLASRFNAWAKAEAAAGRMRCEGGSDHVGLEQKIGKPDTLQPRPNHPPMTLDDTCPPFRYRHLGSLAYIGGEAAAIDLGQAGAFTGTLTFWLWKSVYLSNAVSIRTKLNLAFDWFKTFFFGRDTSKP